MKRFGPSIAASNYQHQSKKKVSVAPARSTFYAVHVGHRRGVYLTWDEASKQVSGFPKAVFRKFSTRDEAQRFADLGPLASGTVAVVKNARPVYIVSDVSLPPGLVSDPGTGDEFSARIRPLAGVPTGDALATLVRESATINNERLLPMRGPQSTRLVPSGTEDLPIPPKVYCDGACEHNGTSRAKAAFGVWWGEAHPWNLPGRVPGAQTNQRAEALGYLRTMQMLDELFARSRTGPLPRVLVLTDSLYVIKSLRDDIPKWKTRNWRKLDGNPPLHLDILLKAMLLTEAYPNVTVRHVKGHYQSQGNNGADLIARSVLKGVYDYRLDDTDSPTALEI